MNLAELIKGSKKEKLINSIMEYFEKQEAGIGNKVVLHIQGGLTLDIIRYRHAGIYHMDIKYNGTTSFKKD